MIRLVCLLVVGLCFNLVTCFDTGHHYDATRNGLELRNFSRNSDAIPIVQLCNFIPDWDSLSYEVNMPNFNYYKQLANLLHFGNLFNSTMVRDYWVQFIINQHDTVNAILNNTIQQKINSKNDASLPLLDQQYLLLCTLGYSLHATQDFYAHSNYLTSLVNNNTNNNNNNMNNTYNNATCYYTANVYDFLNDTTTDYNLHTYYWPEKDSKQQDMKNQIQQFWPNETLVKHGYYLDGINKDSYGKMNWDMAYSSAFMATLDVIDTWRGWIQNETLWNLLQNYNFTGSNATSEYSKLDEGQQQEFEFSNYLKVPGFDDSKDGHWKGPNSGQFVETVKEAADWIRNDWQWNSPYQRAFYDTDISQRLTHGLDGTMPGVESDFMIPNVTSTIIQSFNATNLGLVINDPADYIAITVRTWGAGKWKTTPTNSSDQEIDGWYAIVGIDGQEFREATQYQSWVQPFWTAMRFIPVNQSNVTITYDLIDYANDNTLKSLFKDTHDIEAVIHPNNSSESAQDSNLDVQIIPANVSRVQRHTMRLVPVPNEEMMKALGKAALLRDRLHHSSHRVHTLNHRTNVSDPYTYRDTINPDDMNRLTHGVVFVMDTSSGQVISGLPSFFLNRAYLDANHSLILQGMNTTANVAQVNITVTPRHMCSTKLRQNATIGEVGPALVAAPIDGWGKQPTGTDIESGTSSVFNMNSILLLISLIGTTMMSQL